MTQEEKKMIEEEYGKSLNGCFVSVLIGTAVGIGLGLLIFAL